MRCVSTTLILILAAGAAAAGPIEIVVAHEETPDEAEARLAGDAEHAAYRILSEATPRLEDEALLSVDRLFDAGDRVGFEAPLAAVPPPASPER